ncbi:RNA polymerase sigma factor [Priestia taiwanensis]|uniref:RNA polymerase sigma factor n=1 Tax=Priestia taiwanensis TaxID=1347902 RepID=A0A917ELG0_9BACI|nr:RNA polymerase sigma factor [Priestia taiwanensis]MBM7361856.1 RNA polymerase sigma-70 factor (ECF subfamily) [Priestia taiwanensis]GGE57460.1 RNA polymerase sigma factor [Priestia taiwanensis]
MDSDVQLIQQIIGGDTSVFRQLIKKYETRVYSVAFKVTNNQKDAEDVTQEVFLQLYRSLHSFRQDANLSTWIYRITMNKALDFKRKKDRQTINETNTLHDIKPISPVLTPEQELVKKTEQELLYEALNKLPPPYQEVLNLYYFENKSYQEIATTLNIAVKTVESRLYRAKNILKANELGGRK